MNSDQHAGLHRALLAGIAANLGVAVAKFVAYSFTHSAAMLAEAVHSVADSTNQLLLLVGWKRSQRGPDETHPLGYSTERYFWSFVVAMNIFVLGAIVAIYEGISKIRHPHPVENVPWIFAALALALIFEGFALRIAWREFRHFRVESEDSLWQSLRNAKDLSLPTVLFEDSAALLGIFIAAVGTLLSLVTHNGLYDGLASLCIGILLLVVAWFLATESHSLLIGESASAEDRRKIEETVEQHPSVDHLLRLTTLHRGPDDLLVAIEADFRDDLTVAELEKEIPRLEESIRSRVPTAKSIFVEARSIFGRSPE